MVELTRISDSPDPIAFLRQKVSLETVFSLIPREHLDEEKCDQCGPEGTHECSFNAQVADELYDRFRFALQYVGGKVSDRISVDSIDACLANQCRQRRLVYLALTHEFPRLDIRYLAERFKPKDSPRTPYRREILEGLLRLGYRPPVDEHELMKNGAGASAERKFAARLATQIIQGRCSAELERTLVRANRYRTDSEESLVKRGGGIDILPAKHQGSGHYRLTDVILKQVKSPWPDRFFENWGYRIWLLRRISAIAYRHAYDDIFVWSVVDGHT
jgi:hypothetical protein